MAIAAIRVEGIPAARALVLRKARFVENFLVISGNAMFREVKEDIRGEVRGQYYLAGNRRPWARTRDFGDLVGGRPALRSYAGKWSGAPVTFSAGGRVARIKIKAEGASAHVGGRGLQRNQVVTAIKPRGAPEPMQAAVHRKHGARVSRATLLGEGLQLPSRPHANPNNPVTARKVEVVMGRKFEEA